MARKAPPLTPPADRPSAAELLAQVLPLAEPTADEVHLHASLLEVGDPAQLVELAADPTLQPYLLCRLAPNVALVDPGRAEDLTEALRRRGHTPKVVKNP